MSCVTAGSRIYKSLGALVVFSLVATVARPSAAQDFTYGGDARSYGMGGAGISLLQFRSSRQNPATLAFENKEMDPTFPTIGMRALGPINKDNAGSYILNGTKNKDALSIARQFGSTDSEFGVNATAGFRVGLVEVSGYAVGTGKLQPNSAFQTWTNTANRDYSLLPQDAQSDVYTAGYYALPTIAFGKTIPLKKSAPTSFLNADRMPVVGVGLRVKMMNAVYSHYIADYNSLLGLADAKLAPEMNGSNTVTRRGIGADLGLLVRPRYGKGISGGLVVANAVKPNFNFDSTDRNGNPTRVSLLRTTITTGMGYEDRYRGTALAADIVDLTSAAGAAQFRFGAEQRIWGPIALRAGYNTGYGPTYGISFFGIDAAFGKKLPLEVVRTMKF